MAEGQSTITRRILPGHPGYEVGDDGSLWGTRLSRGRVRRTPKRIRGKIANNGYVAVIIYGDGGVRRHVNIHTLVLEAFVGPCPEDKEARHHDGNRQNNALANLSWATHLENEADKISHGTLLIGDRHPNAHLNTEKVRAIRQRVRVDGISTRAVGREFGISQGTVSDILHGRTWGHVA